MRCAVLVCLFIAFQSHAQESEKKQSRFSYGVTLGPTLSELQFTGNQVGSSYRNTPTLGVRAGIVTKFNASKHFFFTGGISYASEKAKLTQVALSLPDASSELINQYNFNWINLPLSFNYIINPKSRSQAFIGCGIIGKKLLSSKMILTSNITDATTNTTSSITNENSSMDLFENFNAFGCFSSGVQFLGKYNDALLLSISIDRSLFEMVRPMQTDSQAFFNYAVVTPQLKITNFSLNITYAIR